MTTTPPLPRASDQAAERTLFEAIAGPKSFYLKEMPEKNKRGPDIVYYNQRTQHAWEGFQMGYAAIAHSAAQAPTLDAILNCYSPDDTVGDYQDKIRALWASAAQAPEDAAKLACLDCGVDRMKLPCPRMADECAMIGDAHLLARAAQGAGTAPCQLPLHGWACTRPSGHAGPCAAWPTEEIGEEIEEKHARANNQGIAQDEGNDSSTACASRGPGAHQHNEHREMQSGADRRDGCENGGGARVSDRGEVREAVKKPIKEKIHPVEKFAANRWRNP